MASHLMPPRMEPTRGLLPFWDMAAVCYATVGTPVVALRLRQPISKATLVDELPDSATARTAMDQKAFLHVLEVRLRVKDVVGGPGLFFFLCYRPGWG